MPNIAGNSPTAHGIFDGHTYPGILPGVSPNGNSVTLNQGARIVLTAKDFSIAGDLGLNEGVSGNSAHISGGAFTASDFLDIFGGRSYYGNATGNSVTLSGSPVFLAGSDVRLVGGDGTTGDLFTDNTLNVWEYSQGSSVIHTVKNFQYYNFVLPANLAYGSTLLSANTIMG